MKIFEKKYPKWKDKNGLFFTMNTELPIATKNNHQKWSGMHWICMAAHFNKTALRRSARHKKESENILNITKIKWYIFDALNQPKMNMSGTFKTETIDTFRSFFNALLSSFKVKVPSKPTQVLVTPKQKNTWDCGLSLVIIMENFNKFAIKPIVKKKMPKVAAPITEFQQRRKLIKDEVLEQYKQVKSGIGEDIDQ